MGLGRQKLFRLIFLGLFLASPPPAVSADDSPEPQEAFLFEASETLPAIEEVLPPDRKTAKRWETQSKRLYQLVKRAYVRNKISVRHLEVGAILSKVIVNPPSFLEAAGFNNHKTLTGPGSVPPLRVRSTFFHTWKKLVQEIPAVQKFLNEQKKSRAINLARQLGDEAEVYGTQLIQTLPGIVRDLRLDLETWAGQSLAQELAVLPEWQRRAAAEARAMRLAGAPSTQDSSKWKTEDLNFFRPYAQTLSFLDGEQSTAKRVDPEPRDAEFVRWYREKLTEATSKLLDAMMRAKLYWAGHRDSAISPRDHAEYALKIGEIRIASVERYGKEVGLGQNGKDLFHFLRKTYLDIRRDGEKSILPTWNLLSQEEKKQRKHIGNVRAREIEGEFASNWRFEPLHPSTREFLNEVEAMMQSHPHPPVKGGNPRNFLNAVEKGGIHWSPWFLNEFMPPVVLSLTILGVGGTGLYFTAPYWETKLSGPGNSGFYLDFNQGDTLALRDDPKPTEETSTEPQQAASVFQVRTLRWALPDHYHVIGPDDVAHSELTLLESNRVGIEQVRRKSDLEISLLKDQREQNIGDERGVFLLNPRDHRLIGIEVTGKDGNPVPANAEIFVHKTKNGLFWLRPFGNWSKEHRYSAYYERIEPKAVSAKPPQHIRPKVLEEIQKLRDSGATHLAAEIEKRLAVADSEGRLMHLGDSVIAFQGEDYRKGTMNSWPNFFGGSHYARFQKFMGPDGVLHYTCNNAKGCFLEFARRTLSPEDASKLRKDTLYVLKNADGKIGADNAHVRLELTVPLHGDHREPQRQAMVFVTPNRYWSATSFGVLPPSDRCGLTSKCSFLQARA